MVDELIFQFSGYNHLKRCEQIKLIKNMFPIGIKVYLLDDELGEYIDIVGVKKTEVIGYDLESVTGLGDRYVPGLIIKDLPKDDSYCVLGKSIHPGYVFYDKVDFRDVILKNLLDE